MKRTRPRIAHVVLDLHEGGLERLVVDLALGSRPLGFDTRVFCLNRRGQLADELAAEDTVVVSAEGGALGMWVPRALANAIEEFGADLIHAHSGVFFKAMRAGRLTGIPVILTDHGRPHPDPLQARILDGIAARGADHVVAVSEPLRAYLRRSLHVPERSLSVIRNGVRPFNRPDTEDVAAARISFTGTARNIVGSVGRLDPVKAYDVLIEAMSLIVGEWPGADVPHLVLVGDGPDRGRLERLIADLNMAEHVTITGWLTDVRPALCAFDVFALVSDSEGTSVSLLEAMQSGRAVVASEVGGNPQVLGEHLRTQLCPPRDPRVVAQKISTLLQSPARRAEIAALGMQQVATYYSQRSMLAEYATVYAAMRK